MKTVLSALGLLLLYYVIIVVSTTFSPALFMNFPGKSANKHVVITAHRGSAGYAPENTLAAIRKGLASGADRIEVDIHQSKDGQLFIMHDVSVDRTTNGHGLLKNYTSDSLKKLDAGSWFSPEYKGEPVPTLEEAFKLINGKAVFVVELKHGSDMYPGIEEKVIDLIRKYNAYSWVIIHSFDDKVLQRFHQLDHRIELHKLFVFKTNLFPLIYDLKVHFGSLKKYNNVKEISVYYKFVNKPLINAAHRMGFKINAWTVNDPDIARRLIYMGVDGIITDYPSEIIRQIEAEKIK